MTTGTISIRQVAPASERPTVLRLLKENLPEAAAEGRFDWAYLENPDGEASVWLAETADGEAVGPRRHFRDNFGSRADTCGRWSCRILPSIGDTAHWVRRSRCCAQRWQLLTMDRLNSRSIIPASRCLAVYRAPRRYRAGPLTRYVRLLKAKGAASRRWGPGLTASVVGSLGDFAIRTLDRFGEFPGG